MILVRLIDLYSLVVLGAVVLSWIGASRGNALANAIRSLTEPALGPIRRVLPPLGGLDFSPMVLLVGLQLVRNLVVGAMF